MLIQIQARIEPITQTFFFLDLDHTLQKIRFLTTATNTTYIWNINPNYLPQFSAQHTPNTPAHSPVYYRFKILNCSHELKGSDPFVAVIATTMPDLSGQWINRTAEFLGGFFIVESYKIIVNKSGIELTAQRQNLINI